MATETCLVHGISSCVKHCHNEFCTSVDALLISSCFNLDRTVSNLTYSPLSCSTLKTFLLIASFCMISLSQISTDPLRTRSNFCIMISVQILFDEFIASQAVSTKANSTERTDSTSRALHHLSTWKAGIEKVPQQS